MPDEMTDLSSQRFSRLYESYTTTHAGRSNFASEARLIHRDVIPHLAVDHRDRQEIVDLGCGQGALVHTLVRAGYARAVGIDISPEQVALAHADGVDSIAEGDYRQYLQMRRWNAVTAVDFVEHLDHNEVLQWLTSSGRAWHTAERSSPECQTTAARSPVDTNMVTSRTRPR